MRASTRRIAAVAVRSAVARPAATPVLIRGFSAAIPRTARVVRFERTGAPEHVLSIREEEVAAPSDGEVVVKMIAAPINPADLNMVEGVYGIKPSLPAVAGNEGVGEIVAAGSGVSLKTGDKVIPSKAGLGTWRTAGVFQAGDWLAAPANIPDEYAATISVNPTSAWRMLDEFVKLQPGDVVIQNAGNSMVGEAVAQIAASRDIKTISVIRSRPDFADEVERLKALGAFMVVSEDYLRTPPFKRIMADLPAPKLALNSVGGASATELARSLAEGGTMVTYGGMSRKPVTVPTSALIFKDLTLRGFWLKDNAPANAAARKGVVDLIQQEKLKLWMQTWDFADFEGALKRHKEQQRGRKVVLKF